MCCIVYWEVWWIFPVLHLIVDSERESATASAWAGDTHIEHDIVTDLILLDDMDEMKNSE